ncbi:dihydrodipicolinate synthase family protein [Halobium palmae]|uniref:Dihydrodipicolinate synthase family protein n=1 Tax=Halobium palmae TaxID=1776492 RepID=A0ABD5RZM5_9EURY
MSAPTGVAFFPVTVFDRRGEFDEARYKAHIQSTLQQAPFSCVIPLGSVGEFAYLSTDERKDVVEATIDAVDGSVPVVAGASTIATREAVELTNHASRTGADGVLVTPQSYFPPTERTVLNYFTQIVDQTDIPVWVYNNPSTTNIDMSCSLLSRLFALDSVVCVKSGSGDMRSFRNLRRTVGDTVDLYAAPPNMFEKLALGADGWSGPVATIDPDGAIELFRMLQNDGLTAARKLFEQWQPLLNYFDDYPYVATMKAILNLQGRDVGRPRPPVQPLGDVVREDLRAVMGDLNVL